MGSEVVEAIVKQIGRIVTNPADLVPDISRPIEQIAYPLNKIFQPLQQFARITTAGGVGPDSFSRPVEQAVYPFKFPKEGGSGDIIEQVILASEPLKSIGGGASYEGPIEQRDFITVAFATKPVQQFILSNETTKSKPVEQVSRITNAIDVTQFDFIELIFPPCNTNKNPIDVNILWRIKDFGFPFDVSTLVFKINGIPVQDRAEFTVTAIVGGLQLDYNPPDDFDFEEEVQVVLEIEDTAVPPNFFFYRCAWITVPDTRAPIVVNVEPECNSTGVDASSPVEFDVLDVGAGVDPDSIRLTIEGVTVCSGVTLDPTTVPGSGTGYHVTYEHPGDPFRYDASITIGVEATDLSPARNNVLFVCFFNTEESEAPTFMSFSPEPCESFVDNTTGLIFEVYGVEHGIDISTLEVRVDNELRKVFVRPRILRSQ